VSKYVELFIALTLVLFFVARVLLGLEDVSMYVDLFFALILVTSFVARVPTGL
jgi:hypothetical protein